MLMSRGWIVLLALVLGVLPAQGQPAPQGTPFSVTHFGAQEYRAQPRNWSIAQDERGLMYVANNGGILQYDGTRWRRIGIDDSTFGRSVATDAQGTVYAGAVSDFGVLRPDSTATLRYVSLSDRLPPGERDFTDVWYTHTTGGDVYFQSRERLFRWDGDTLRSWKSETNTFHTSFVVRGRLYVRESGRGLLRMEGDSLRVVPGGERFDGTSVYVMVPHGTEKILVGTSKKNFFLYDGQQFTPFSTEADPLLNEHQLYHGSALPGGEVALATLGDGVLVIDREGRLVRVLDPDASLPGGMVSHVSPDGQGGLWMALYNQGVARAEVSSPLSRFGEGFGLEGIVRDLNRHNGTLYAATGAGLYRLVERRAKGRRRHRFEQVPEVPAAWELLSSGGALYAATGGGVYRVEQNGGVALFDQTKAFDLAAFGEAPEHLYVGTPEGLGTLRRARSGWEFALLDSTKAPVLSLATTENDEALWYSTKTGTAFRLSKAQLNERDAPLRPRRFDEDDGLPDDGGNVATFQQAPVFMSKEGLYRLRRTATDTSFYADTTLTGSLQDKGPLRAFYKAGAGSAWLFYDGRTEIVRRRRNGTFERTTPPALQFPREGTTRALIEPNGSAWISDGNELLHYDAARARRLRNRRAEAPSMLVRGVRDAATGTLVYGGAAAPGSKGSSKTGRETGSEAVEVPYRQNSVRITFALPRYGGATPPRYQYRLKGEDEWSDPGLDAQTRLSNLYEGSYTLEARARNADGDVLSRASITLDVLPPWYRTVWAYLSYLAAGVLATAGYRHYRGLRERHRHAREQARHHRRETEREREAREQLQRAHARLEEADRLKANFLANTSHEFRTPLASIMGYAEVLQSDDLPHEQEQEFLDIIYRSGDRLLNTVNMLLEISQLRAGALHMSASAVEVNQQVAQAATPFREAATDKELAFDIAPAPEPIQARLPAPYFRRIVENLVDNAVKFTSSGLVRVSVHDAGVEVRDTGVGMDEDESDVLFGEFKQASEGISRAYEGIGLGLTIAGRLARLMGGGIEVESAPGEGSTFTVRVPKAPASEEEHDAPEAS
jgi:signal transduction histidine kinase/ligand-binding sensor domain-containing protein